MHFSTPQHLHHRRTHSHVRLHVKASADLFHAAVHIRQAIPGPSLRAGIEAPAVVANADGQSPGRTVVLTDINLPGKSGIEVIIELKNRFPAMQFMMLTVNEDDDKIFQALEAGATGYLLKSTAPAKIMDAVRELYEGGSPMSAQIARKVVDRMHSVKSDSGESPYAKLLSDREKKVLDRLRTGMLYKQIADQLHISEHTVKTHCRHIYEKLHVTTRGEAVHAYFSKRQLKKRTHAGYQAFISFCPTICIVCPKDLRRHGYALCANDDIKLSRLSQFHGPCRAVQRADYMDCSFEGMDCMFCLMDCLNFVFTGLPGAPAGLAFSAARPARFPR